MSAEEMGEEDMKLSVGLAQHPFLEESFLQSFSTSQSNVKNRLRRLLWYPYLAHLDAVCVSAVRITQIRPFHSQTHNVGTKSYSIAQSLQLRK